MVELLPYLGSGDYVNLRPERDKPWWEMPNLLMARIPVTYFLTPPGKGGAPSYQVTYPGHVSLFAASHWVGIAGVGLDAASYQTNDPSLAAKLGIFGYDRVTKPEDVKDGLDKTIALIQVPPESAGPWIAGGGSTLRGVSEADDCVEPFVCTKYNDQRGTFAIMGSGDVRFIPKKISPEMFRAMCTIAGDDKLRELNRIAPLVERKEVEEPAAAQAEPAPVSQPQASVKAESAPSARAPDAAKSDAKEIPR
jgi:hypothetical protein